MEINITTDVSKGPAEWRTVKRSSQIEFVERKSRFIAYCFPISDPAHAEARLKEMRDRYPDATHHVYAWHYIFPQIGGKYSDDGEPKGTAGMPVLNVLKQRGIDQAGIIVVRYFGGVKLGAGGLVRAYGQAAGEALDAAEPLTMARRKRFLVSTSYALHETLRYNLEKLGYYQGETEFSAKVAWPVAVAPADEEQLKTLLADLSQGEASCEFLDLEYAPA